MEELINPCLHLFSILGEELHLFLQLDHLFPLHIQGRGQTVSLFLQLMKFC